MSEVRDELIELRGLRFHFREWPSARADAPTLVLLHGYTGHARSWDFVGRAFADRYRVLALDQRGHGETQWVPSGDYGTREMVEDLKAFVDAMALQDFALLGLSMGGIVSYAYAGERPSPLARLVIVDIAPEIDPVGLAQINTNVARPDVFDTPEDAFQQARETNPVPPEAHQRERVIQGLMRLADGRWTYRYDRALRSGVPREGIPPEEGWGLVANIAVPALLIRGENSNILEPAVARRMVEEIADCRFEQIAGSGHSVPLDRPDDFLVALQRFL